MKGLFVVFLRRTILVTGLLLFLAAFVFLAITPADAGPWWQSSINVESKVGTDRSIQSLDVMYPITHTDDSLTFTDLRGRIDDDDSVELNLGLAHRYATSDLIGISDQSVLGFYGFADRLESRFDNTFYQGTAGFEYFTKDYSLRLNGYLPEDEHKPTTFFTQLQATGTQIFFEDRANFERPLPGYDVELGRTLRFDGWQLYGRGSYFRFHHSDVAEIEGKRFRAGLQFDGSHPEVYLPEGSQLTIGMEWQNDSVRDEQTFGVMRMSIPFGGQPSAVSHQPSAKNSEPSNLNTKLRSWQKDRLTERIERDVDVVTGASGDDPTGETQPAVVATTGETLTSVALAEGSQSGGAGTFENPGDLGTALDRAGTDGTILVSSDGGVLRTNGETILEGQTLYGANVALPLVSPDGSNSTVFQLGTDRPTIEGTGSVPTLQIDTGTSGSHLQGLSLRGGSEALRVGDNVTNARLEDLTVPAGDLLIGDSVGRGSGNRFTLNDVTVQSGNLRIGRNVGAVLGAFEARNVVVSEGDMTIDRYAGSDPAFSGRGGRFVLRNVTVGDSFSVEHEAGSSRGSFVMSGVDVTGSLSVGDAAGQDGSFAMSSVDVGETLTIGFRPGDDGFMAGDDEASFSMSDVDVGKTLAVGQGAGARGGNFSASSVNVGDTVSIALNMAAGGTAVVSGVQVGNGFDMGQNAAAGGSLSISEVTTGGSLSIGDDAALDTGSLTLSQVEVGENLSVGNNAGANNGSFTLTGSTVGGTMAVGDDFGEGGTGRIQGTFVEGQLRTGSIFSGTLISDTVGSLKIGSDADGRVADVTVRSGDLAVGEGAGQGAEDRFEMERVTVASGNMTMGQFPGGTDGSLRMDTVTVKEGFLEFDGFVGNGGKAVVNHITTGDTLAVGIYAGANAGKFELLSSTIESDNLTFGSNAADLGGSVRLEKNQVLDGSIQYGSFANAAGITCTGNTDADGNPIDSDCP